MILYMLTKHHKLAICNEKTDAASFQFCQAEIILIGHTCGNLCYFISNFRMFHFVFKFNKRVPTVFLTTLIKNDQS